MSVELQKGNIFNGPEVSIENIRTEMAQWRLWWTISVCQF